MPWRAGTPSPSSAASAWEPAKAAMRGLPPLCQYLNALSSYSGSAVIAAAGNETGLGHHYRGAMAPASLSHTVELAVAENEKGFTMEFWAQEIELYTIGFISPTGEAVSPLPASTTDENAVTFLLEETKIRVYYQLADFSTGSQLILIRMEDPAPGIWRITVSASLRLRGGFHIWLPVREFISEGTYFLRPDPDTVITDPGNARGPITVSAYDHQTGGIYLHASRGYTRLGTGQAGPGRPRSKRPGRLPVRLRLHPDDRNLRRGSPHGRRGSRSFKLGNHGGQLSLYEYPSTKVLC